MKKTLYIALFSVAGGPFEEIARGEDKTELLQEIKDASAQWSCRTHGYVREANANEQKQT